MKSFRYIALAALTLSFAACTQEDDFTPQGDSDAVKINATIGAMQTRVAYDANGTTTFTKGDAFKVVNTMRSTKNEATYTTTDGTTWTTADAFVWNGGTATNQFQAWYPATASYDSFTLPTNQSVGIEVADWMTATTIEIWKPDDGVLNLNFYHRLAKVTVEIADWNSEFDNQTHEITDPIIYSKGTYLTADYDDFDGSVTITSTGNDIGITPLVNGDKESYTAIVAPVKYNTSDTFMTFTVKGQEMTVKANGNTTLTEGLKAGYHYTFYLTVGKEAVSIASVDVTPWFGEDIDGGVAEEVTSPNDISATEMDAETLNGAVTNALELGYTDISITLAADAGEDMFKAITSALSANGIAEGSIDLTISGALEVPQKAFCGEQSDNENYRASKVLKSVTLTDATTICELAFFGCNMSSFSAPNVISIEGGYALDMCTNLTEIYLPSVQTLGSYVFADCSALKTISIPECVTIGNNAFVWCKALETVYAPKATKIGAAVFQRCTSLTKVTLGSVESVNKPYESYGLFDDANDTNNIDLVLSSEQKVMTFDSDTKYWTATETDYNGSDDHNNKLFIGYVFKSVSLQ